MGIQESKETGWEGKGSSERGRPLFMSCWVLFNPVRFPLCEPLLWMSPWTCPRSHPHIPPGGRGGQVVRTATGGPLWGTKNRGVGVWSQEAAAEQTPRTLHGSRAVTALGPQRQPTPLHPPAAFLQGSLSCCLQPQARKPGTCAPSYPAPLRTVLS